MATNNIPAGGGEFIHQCNYLVVGSGMAGLYAAIRLAESGSVALITKAGLQDSNTVHAQGGIAAAVDPTDSPEFHFEDTMRAGAGLCDPEAVRVLVDEGPDRVRDLVRLGVSFDRSGGRFSLTREAAHRSRRILHVRDATGRAISEGLVRRLHGLPVRIFEHCMALDLIIHDGRCRGVRALTGDGKSATFEADCVVLASGAAGQVFRTTTNPEVATGDGLAMALRAGAVAADMEFVQFHPTALHLEGAPPFLISEAMRGEGAVLLDHQHLPFMHRYHPSGELAPRDVVARAIFDQIRQTGHPHVYLLPPKKEPAALHHRFPTIYETCQQYGLDISREPIPVAPAAHYMMGGLKTDLFGRSSIPGLFACGEVACTGAHGANRLASNSLLEAVVFAGRIASYVERSAGNSSDWPSPPPAELKATLFTPEIPSCESEDAGFPALSRLQRVMTENVGIIRDAKGLDGAMREIDELARRSFASDDCGRAALELRNMLQVALTIARSAAYREESRGSHFRSDFPETSESWRRRITIRIG